MGNEVKGSSTMRRSTAWILSACTCLVCVSGYGRSRRIGKRTEAKVFLKQTRLWMSQKQQNEQEDEHPE